MHICAQTLTVAIHDHAHGQLYLCPQDYVTSQLDLCKIIIVGGMKQGCGVGVGSRWSRMFSAGVGFQNCWSRSRFFKTAGVGFSKLLESGVGTFVAITDSNVY